ncbi:unnamed protein product [Callosobruchus maculatus]|uniref:1-alkyl-2-acetylglycerophosphocholine esterase n=1 Tax=Callosobruchus maculatus TaxID=64391 RepID=A0A653DG48_CALMS|nr:unnamed protein product [Callosobruchus maculatus]
MSNGIEPKHLPKATGPFVPGMIDVSTDYGEEGLLMRLYYPTNEKKNDPKQWMTWLPENSYLRGLANVTAIPYYFLRSAIWWYGHYYIPSLYGKKIRTDDKLKCIIISHGLGSCRFLYSAVCYDLASYGYLVICLEHKDRSACFTYYYATKEDAQKDKKTEIHFKHVPLGKNHYTERNQQIKIKANECSKAIDFVLQLNKGTAPANVLDEVVTKYTIDFDLKDLTGKIDVDSLTIMGHSFGAATAIYTAALRSEIKQCIAMDPWMFPIKDENLHEKVKQPILFVNTYTFHLEANVKSMAKFLTIDRKDEMYTILNSTHETQTDTVFILGYWLNWFMRKIDPTIGLRINNYIILEFLNRHTLFPKNVEEQKAYLDKEKHNYMSGLTKPWA